MIASTNIWSHAIDLEKVPCYRVYRIKESQKEHFRWSAHTGGLAVVKPKDYELGGQVESHSPYSLWKELQDPQSGHPERPLCPGDVLETIGTEGPVQLYITKYIGFEPAQWFIAEAKVPTSPADDVSKAQVQQSEGALQS